jgi:hypothetical protein
MIINGINNQTVEIKIINYEFPNRTDDDWDNNWLNIYLKVKSEVGNWQTIDPSLITWEVKAIIDWFLALSRDEIPNSLVLDFLEPNLSFELLDSNNERLKMFRINFDLELRPKSAIDDKKYFVDCLADNIELTRIADELQIELDKYPQR